jgi:oligopeptide/dipeptide ABC transporter ATP-binding protein
MSQPVLQVHDLRTQFFTDDGVVQAVDGVSFDLHPGETLGIVGESGSGKSVTALSILRLVQEPGRIVSGQILFKGADLVTMPEEEVREIRGRDIAMIFQDPLSSLNPVLKIGFQVEEAMEAHRQVSGKQALSRTVQLLKQVRIPGAESRVDDYPHQFSGGMRQRVMIAMGLANQPSILIADEPTTALDVTVQAQILELLRDLNHQLNTAIILITHNMGVVAGLCSRVAVMYAGRIVEVGPAVDVFRTPRHPYTLGLLNSIPDIKGGGEGSGAGGDLPVIPGTVPNLINPPAGCSYHPRCPFAFDRCRVKVPELQKAGDQQVACHLYDPDVALPEALKNRDASVYLRPPGADAYNPNPTLRESDAPSEAKAG